LSADTQASQSSQTSSSTAPPFDVVRATGEWDGPWSKQVEADFPGMFNIEHMTYGRIDAREVSRLLTKFRILSAYEMRMFRKPGVVAGVEQKIAQTVNELNLRRSVDGFEREQHGRSVSENRNVEVQPVKSRGWSRLGRK